MRGQSLAINDGVYNLQGSFQSAPLFRLSVKKQLKIESGRKISTLQSRVSLFDTLYF